jgi:hypothetical protein
MVEKYGYEFLDLENPKFNMFSPKILKIYIIGTSITQFLIIKKHILISLKTQN